MCFDHFSTVLMYTAYTTYNALLALILYVNCPDMRMKKPLCLLMYTHIR